MDIKKQNLLESATTAPPQILEFEDVEEDDIYGVYDSEPVSGDIETDVVVSYDLCLGYTNDGSEVGISIQDVSDYHIQAVEQFYNIQNGTGAVGGGASYIASLINTVPIALTVFQLSNDPEILTPSAEPYEDLNESGGYDDGEPFTDALNGVWDDGEKYEDDIEISSKKVKKWASRIWDINPEKVGDNYPIFHDKGSIGGLIKGFFGYNGDPSLIELITWLLTASIMGFLWKTNSSKS